MNWFRISISDLLLGTVAVAILVSVNLRSVDIGSGIEVNAIGWPLKFHATTIADILETTINVRIPDVKSTLFFDEGKLTINVGVGFLIVLAVLAGRRFVEKCMRVTQKGKNAI